MTVTSGSASYKPVSFAGSSASFAQATAPSRTSPAVNATSEAVKASAAKRAAAAKEAAAAEKAAAAKRAAAAKETAAAEKAAAAKRAAAAKEAAAANTRAAGKAAITEKAVAAKNAKAEKTVTAKDAAAEKTAVAKDAHADKKPTAPAPDPTPTPGTATVAKPTVAPAQGPGVIVGSDPVIVEIKNSDSGYANKIYWSDDGFKTQHYLGVDNTVGTYTLGSFTAGTRIDFGIDNGMNQFFTTGAASSNADDFEHARATATADGVQVGFEDLFGGGDQDFNDAIVTVRSASPETTQTPDNRSGLGDGTNPGQGAGTTNSPNTGTANPNNAGAYGSTPPPSGGRVNVFV